MKMALGKIQNTRFYAVDSVMGSGKTSAAINMINSAGDDEKFFFITPYLKQVDRIIHKCADKQFVQPQLLDNTSTKRDNLKQLIKERKNIASTHAMFNQLTEEIVRLFKDNDYTLIIDEVITCIEESTEYSAKDLQTMIDFGMLSAPGKYGLLSHNFDGENSKLFGNLKYLCESSRLAYSRSSTGSLSIVSLFPINALLAFREVYILTYMFEGQGMASYLKLHSIQYEKLGVAGTSTENYHFSRSPTVGLPIDNIGDLIYISDKEKRNRIGEENSLSHTWYDNPQNKDTVIKIAKNTYNFFHNDLRRKPKATIWTCFDSNKDLFKSNIHPYENRRIPLNVKASNDYMDCTAVAYPINLFYNPYLKNFLSGCDAQINEDAFALSEMLQFIWRSAIRRGESIDIYIPSTRMRGLLENWIKIVSPAS